MERDKVLAVVKPLFDREACVSRDEVLACIEQSPDISAEDKYVLQSLWNNDCYTYESFRDALEAYGRNAPIGYGSNLGGF
jgi:hypothetical protein